MEATLKQRALGGESFELRELNERLEVYLHRVTLLEQENTSLRGEIQALKRIPASGKRRELEEELEQLRDSLEERWREVDQAALERDSLREELRLVQERCAGEASRGDEARRQLAESRRELDEEKRAQVGLGRKALTLEGELKFLEGLHQEEIGNLQEERSRALPSLAQCPVPSPGLCPQEVDLYSQKLSQIWKGSLEIYQKELVKMEHGLAEARGRQETVKEEKRQSRLKLLSLQKEMEVLRERKGLLEGRASQQNEKQQQDLEEFQATIGLLEQDKESLAAKMDRILDEQRQLMQTKLALSLEVATYRALLDAEVGRIRSSSETPGLPVSHRDASLELDWTELGFQGRRAVSMEKSWCTSKKREADKDIRKLRAPLHSGTDSPAYGLRGQSLPRGNRPKESHLLMTDIPSSESEATAHSVRNQEAIPALGGAENSSSCTIPECAVLPQIDSQSVDVERGEGLLELHQFDGETKGSVTEEQRQEKTQLNGDVNEGVIDREESEENIDLVLDTIVLNGTSKKPMDDEEPKLSEGKEDLVSEDEEINEASQECLMEEQPQEPKVQFNHVSGKLLSSHETWEHSTENAVEIIERMKDLPLKEQWVNEDAKEQAMEKEQSEGQANPGSEKVTLNGSSSENVKEDDAPQIIQELENEDGQSNTETKQNVRDNRSELPEEEKDLVSPNPLSNGTTEEHMAEVNQEDLGSKKGQLNGEPKEHMVGDKTSEMLEGTIDALPEVRLSSDKTQELVPEQENHQTEVAESGRPEGNNNMESEAVLSSDTGEEHSTEEMSERQEVLQGRDTEEHVAGKGTTEVTEEKEDLTSENGDAKELATDEKFEMTQVNFDSRAEKGQLGDTNGKNVRDLSVQGGLSEPTGKKTATSENVLSSDGQRTEEAEAETTEVQTDEVVEQEEYNGGMKECEIEEALEVSEGKIVPESEKLLSSENIQKHATDEETLISEGIGHLVPEKGQFSGHIEEHVLDTEMSENVLFTNPTEEHAEEAETAPILGEKDLGSEQGERSEDIKEHTAENEELEISEASEQEVSQIEEGKGETLEGMESLGSGMGSFDETILEHAMDQEMAQAGGARHKITEVEHLGTEMKQSNGETEGHGIETKQSEIAEELVDQVAEEGPPSDTKQERVSQDTKFQITEEEVDVGSDKDQLNEEAKERALAKDDSEMPEEMKDITERGLPGDTAKQHATDEPTSEGRNDLVLVKGYLKEDLEHATDKDSSVGKFDPEEFLFSDVTHAQEKPQIEEEMFGMPEEKDNLEGGQISGEAKEHVSEKEPSEIAEALAGLVPGTEPPSDSGQEHMTQEMIQESEGKGDFESKKGQLVEETQLQATEGEKCQTSELKTEAVSGMGLHSGTAMEDMTEDDTKTIGGMPDLLTEGVLVNDTTNNMTEENKKLEITEDKEDLELEKGQFNDGIEECMTESENSEGHTDAVSEKALFSEVRHATEVKSQINEGKKELGSEEGQLSEETEEHIEEDKKPEIDKRTVAATGDNGDYLEMKTTSPAGKMNLVEDEVTLDKEETCKEVENVHQTLARSQSNTSGNMEKGLEPLLDELSESEERQEIEEERAASPFDTENEEKQTQGEEPLTSSAGQSRNADCLSEDLRTQNLPEHEELTKAADGVDEIAEAEQEHSLQHTQEARLEVQGIGSQSLGERLEDVSQLHEPPAERYTRCEGVSLHGDTALWENTLSESSVNAEDVAVGCQKAQTIKEGMDLVPGVMTGDINNDKSDFMTMSNFGVEQDEADQTEESDITSNSNGEDSSTRKVVTESEDDGSINLREAEDETLIEMVDKSQTAGTADVFEDVNSETQCVMQNRWSTPSDTDISATSTDGHSPNASQTVESSANTLGEHGENLEPPRPESPLQESSDDVQLEEREEPQTVVEGREFLNTFQEETLAISKLGADLDLSPGEKKDSQIFQTDGFYDLESSIDRLATTASQEGSTAELVQTSLEKVEDSQHGPREETEGNSLNENQLGSFNRNSPDLNSDTAIDNTNSNDEKTEDKVPEELGKIFREDDLYEPSVAQECNNESGKTKQVEDTYDTEYKTTAFHGTQHSAEDIDDDELNKTVPSQHFSTETEQEAHCRNADLMLPAALGAPSQETDAEVGTRHRSILSLTSKDHELNGLHGEYLGGPGKGEGTAVEKLAAAYHYWSSEDE
ncbi:tanabin-like [Heterodontus francisci]|uniref:tanabin-like n=1 Tax=Heterodontus francisci TaxID=7792 RepID=UPI00355C8BD1